MKLYNLKEAAEVLLIHPRTLRDLINRGEIRAYTVSMSKHYRISEEDIKEYLSKNVVVPGSVPDDLGEEEE